MMTWKKSIDEIDAADIEAMCTTDGECYVVCRWYVIDNGQASRELVVTRHSQTQWSGYIARNGQCDDARTVRTRHSAAALLAALR